MEQPLVVGWLTGQRISELAKQAGFCIQRKIQPNGVDCSKRCYRTVAATHD
jgi:hypothetical protein